MSWLRSVLRALEPTSDAAPGVRTEFARRTLLAAMATTVAAGLSAPASAAPTAAAACQSEPARIVIIGDSLAQGVWGSLYRRFIRTRTLRIVNATAASTGFNRTPYEETVQNLLARHPIDMLVMFTGANDAQDAFGLDGGANAHFGTAAWQDLYRRRIRRFVDPVRQQNVPLIWIGLPIMRSPSFEARISQVRAAHRETCEAYQIPFFDLQAVMSAEDGGYTNVKRDEHGRLRTSRNEDGVHLTEFGCDAVAVMILVYLLENRPNWMNPDIERDIQLALR